MTPRVSLVETYAWHDRWIGEERPILADHQAAIGGPAPARVVRAWLLAVSCFQMGEGRSEFGRIELVDEDNVITVLGGPRR